MSLKDFRILAALGKGSYGSVSKVERATDGQVRRRSTLQLTAHRRARRCAHALVQNARSSSPVIASAVSVRRGHCRPPPPRRPRRFPRSRR